MLSLPDQKSISVWTGTRTKTDKPRNKPIQLIGYISIRRP